MIAAIAIAKADHQVRRSVLLPVAAPFHCALMQPAAEELETYLERVSMQAPRVQVLSNVDTKPLELTSMKQQLVNHVTRPVRWCQSIDVCIELGATEFVEFGYGGILTGLVKQHLSSNVSCRYCKTFRVRVLQYRQGLCCFYRSIGKPEALLEFIKA